MPQRSGRTLHRTFQDEAPLSSSFVVVLREAHELRQTRTPSQSRIISQRTNLDTRLSAQNHTDHHSLCWDKYRGGHHAEKRTAGRGADDWVGCHGEDERCAAARTVEDLSLVCLAKATAFGVTVQSW